MRVLVTGASGFIGTALVRALAARGDEVVGTDRYAPSEALPVAPFITADLRDGYALARAMEGVEVVFHLAALSAISRSAPREYVEVNAEGTDLVLRLARRAGARKVVHLSSSTVYGQQVPRPIPEEHPLAPACEYSRSKAMAEDACLRHADDGYDVTIIRPRVVVGPGRAGIFATLFSLVDLSLPLPLPRRGEIYFQFTSVDDLVAATMRAAEVAQPGQGRIYNVGSEVTRTLREDMAELFAKANSRSFVFPLPGEAAVSGFALLHHLGLGPLVPEQYRIAATDFVLDIRRVHEELGFVPSRANVDGVVEAWEWWRANRRGAGGESALRGLFRWWQPRYQNALQKRPGG